MLSSRRSNTLVAAVSLILTPLLVAGGQSNVAVSPFVSYVPSATSNPLAGFALTFGGTTGLALRGGAELSINNPEPTGTQGGYRPWGADADAMLFLGGLGGGATVFSRSLSPYLFSGIGMTGGDSSGMNIVRHTWSYGVGANIPLGFDLDLFAESRWRMSQYVLPTSKGAPDSKSELRFGLSFHVGGSNEPRRRPPPRRRVERYEDDEEYVVMPAAAPAPAPQVVVVQPAPAPPPATVVVVSPERERERSNTVNINLPGSVRVSRGSSSRSGRSGRSQRVYVSSSSCSRNRSRGCPQRVQEIQVQSVPNTATKVITTRKRKPD